MRIVRDIDADIGEDSPPERVVGWLLQRFAGRRMVVTTGFGMEGCALIDMVARHGGALPVLYLDTGFLFPETLRLRDRLAARYPGLRFERRSTALTPEAQELRYGPELWRRDPDTCCTLRKVEPMRRSAGRRGRVGDRTDAEPVAFARRPAGGRMGLAVSAAQGEPAGGLGSGESVGVRAAHDVPYNELHERGYPTLGCTHCTLPVSGNVTGEYTREGRWQGRTSGVRAASDRRAAEVGVTSGTTVRRDRAQPIVHRRVHVQGIQSRSRQAPGAASARHHRGELHDGGTHFEGDDVTLLKFHGTYQQDDRDARRRARTTGAEKAYAFMVRVALPAGALDCGPVPRARARWPTRYGQRHPPGDHPAGLPVPRRAQGRPQGDHRRASITRSHHARRLRRRPAQRHGLPRPAGRRRCTPAVRAGRRGDRRASSGPPRRRTTRSGSTARSRSPPRRRSRSTATVYLPRKFKTAVGLSTDNCVDIWSQDVGCSSRSRDGRTITGFNLLVGGGLGMTHNKADTTARLAQPLGFVPTEHGGRGGPHRRAIFRDHGNRADRRHARLKYLLAEWGIERFRAEFQRRAAFPLAPPVDAPAAALPRPSRPPPPAATAAGSTASSSRAAASSTPAASGSRRRCTRSSPGSGRASGSPVSRTCCSPISTTAGVEGRGGDPAGARGHAAAQELSAARRFSMACPALPTCGLAVAESERAIPELLDQFEAELERARASRRAAHHPDDRAAPTAAPGPTPPTSRS